MLRAFLKLTGGITLVFVAAIVASGGAAPAPQELAATQSALLQPPGQ